MPENDWQKTAEKICNLVQSATESNDFTNIKADISKAVNLTVDAVRTGINSSISSSINSSLNAANAAREAQRNIQREKYYAQRDMMRHSRTDIRIPTPTPVTKPNKPRVYAEKPRGAVAGPLKAIIGFVTMSVFFITGCTAIAGTLIMRGAAPLFLMVLDSAIFFMGLAAMGVGINGVSQYGLVKRFRQYTRLIGDKEYCEIAALARGTQRTQKFVRRDLKRMIKQHMFLEANFDDKETTFMITENTYQQYRLTMQQMEERKLLENSVTQTPDPTADSEYRKIMNEGNNYIQRIKEANDRLPGEVISDKLFRLESIMQTIFNEVDKHPETAAELHKFMDYYFPTTMKLVDTYIELDSRSIHGENTRNTKAEIESALDVISDAFEKLLDKLFTERAWDISSDISVMKTMLAQDGLR